MKLRHLEVLHAVLQTGSVGRAARLLVSQPAASKLIRHAEHGIGFQLFERVEGRLIPTQELKTLSPQIETLFNQLEHFRGRVLMAFRNPVERALWLRAAAEDPAASPPPDDLDRCLERIRNDGYELSSSPVCPGVMDASAPVIDDGGDAIAALTVPFFATAETRVSLEDLPRLLCETTREISAELGGSRWVHAP